MLPHYLAQAYGGGAQQSDLQPCTRQDGVPDAPLCGGVGMSPLLQFFQGAQAADAVLLVDIELAHGNAR